MLFLISIFSSKLDASPVLIVQTGDAVIPAGQTSGFIPVYLLNTVDSVEGFELVLRVSDSDAVQFSGGLDTTGTLISGWQFSIVSSFPGGIHMLWLPNQFGQDDIPPIAPTTQIRTLVKVPFLLNGLNPGLSYTFDITIDTSLDDFGFSNPLGYLIGIHTDTVVDTSCFQCIDWNGTICEQWILVNDPPCDSSYFDTTRTSYLDTAKTWVFGSTINVVACCVGIRGNLNGDPQELVDLSDLSYMVSFLTAGAAPPACMAEADVNNSGNIDLTDLSMIINYMTAGGTLPNCI
ncbi:MAG: hypothetical protein IPH75_09850 [bacterium]|nr:hypothetical protein [bacterium]